MFIPLYAQYKVQGFILIIILIFMQIFALLSLSILANNTLAIKMARSYQQKSHVFSIAEKALAAMVDSSSSDLHCEIPIMDESQLLNQSLDWWMSVGCEVWDEKLKIMYVYEVLADNILRITLQVFDLQNRTKEILQNTLVKMDNATQRKFWREL
ncbi:MAG TPA: hypothetical protein VHM20_01905 [Gammaproteobacteria bacterium]|jgi:hypothetical protein|nr:hypothetical protein [Gammaproteobacteria bacterium]